MMFQLNVVCLIFYDHGGKITVFYLSVYFTVTLKFMSGFGFDKTCLVDD